MEIAKCLDCGKGRNSMGWCSDCEVMALKESFKNRKSGNLKIDKFVKNTQLNATSVDYLEYIDFEQIDLIEKTNKSRVFKAIWMEGPRRIWDDDAEQWTRNGPTKVVLKRLNKPQNINEEYLKKVSYDFNYHHHHIYLKFFI